MTRNERVNILSTYQDILIFTELVEILGIGENTTYNLLKNKKIYSKKIGKEYKIPKVCVINYIYNKKELNLDDFLNEYSDILDFKEVRKILRYPCRNTLYKILKNNELYYKKVASEYKIPKTSLVEFIFKEYT